MNPRNLIFAISILLCADNRLLGADKASLLNQTTEMIKYFFEPDSQTNMVFIPHEDCPLQFTNILSNTNLFTLEEQQLLNQAGVKYKDVTTNSGPQGSILTSLLKTNLDWCIARFQYTNSDATDEVVFRFRRGSFPPIISAAKYRTVSGDGYNVAIGLKGDSPDVPVSEFVQFKNGVEEGLHVGFYGDHCIS